MQETAILVGLGATQEPYIKILREMGFPLVGIDRNINARCASAVDIHIQESLDNVSRVRELMESRQINPRLVISEGTDSGAVMLGSLNTWFELSGPNLTSILVTRDKAVQRQVASIAGCLQPRVIRSELEFSEALHTQLIKKPRSGQSSIGVELLSPAVCPDYIRKMISDPNSVVEEYLIGDDVSVDGLVYNGKPSITVVAEKNKHKTNAFVDKVLFCRRPTAEELELLNPLLSRLARYFDVDCGLFHSEWKFFEGNYFLIELSWRGGGSLLGSDVASIITGRCVPEIHIKALLGAKSIENLCLKGDISCAMIFSSSRAENKRVLDICSSKNLEYKVVILNEGQSKILDCRSRYACIYIEYKEEDEGWFKSEVLGVLSDIAI